LALRSAGGFLLARGAAGLLIVALVFCQGYWETGILNPAGGLALLAWLASSSAFALLGRRMRWISNRFLGAMLFADSIAAAFAVRATGGIEGQSVLLLALPVLAGGLSLYRRTALALGFLAAVLYGLLGLEELRAGGNPGLLWSSIIFHALLLSAFGLAAGVIGMRVALSLQEAARSRSELQAVRLSTDRIVESISCGLIAVDAIGKIRLLNPEAQRVLGNGESACDIWTLLEDHNRPLLRILEDDLRGSSGGRDEEIKLRCRGGKRVPGWVKVAPVTDSGGEFHGLVMLFWDLTERKRLDELARRRERLATVGELAAGLAHEIRNSLKPITGCIELLQKRGHLAPAAGPMMEVIGREADALQAFLNQFLALARDKTLKFEELDLEELTRAEAQALLIGKRWVGREVRVAEGGGVRLCGDRDWLRQILRNLILNGLEAGECGAVHVGFERFERGGEVWVRVRVCDEGPGLRGLDACEAFQPFTTTKTNGTGLGLSIVQRGVHEHGGSVAFDTAHTGGGRIVVELPTAPAGVSPRNKQAA
jgi:PAS domain S-box-containing protein